MTLLGSYLIVYSSFWLASPFPQGLTVENPGYEPYILCSNHLATSSHFQVSYILAVLMHSKLQ